MGMRIEANGGSNLIPSRGPLGEYKKVGTNGGVIQKGSEELQEYKVSFVGFERVYVFGANENEQDVNVPRKRLQL